MRSTCRLRGFTLIEAVVALAVASLLLTGLTSLLIYALRCLRQFTTYNTVQQQTVLALQSVSQDLGLSNTATMLLGTSDLCVMASPCDVRTNLDWTRLTFTGTDLNYRTWVGYYRTSNGDLHRVEIPLGGSFPVSAVPLGGQPNLPALSAVTGSANRVVARFLQDFQVAAIPGTAATVAVSFRVRLDVDSTHPTELRTSTHVRVRN